jgi:hypothetical protein
MLVKLTATEGGSEPCFSVVRINTSMSEVEPMARMALGSPADEKNWKPGSSAGELKFSAKDGVMDVRANLKEGDRWVYPWLTPAPSEKPDESWDGIAFTLVSSQTPATYHVMLKEPGGATYSTSLPDVPADGKPHRVVMLFNEFQWAGHTPPDGNRKLDLRQIEAIAIGGNPKGGEFNYSVSAIEWVRFAK